MNTDATLQVQQALYSEIKSSPAQMSVQLSTHTAATDASCHSHYSQTYIALSHVAQLVVKRLCHCATICQQTSMAMMLLHKPSPLGSDCC